MKLYNTKTASLRIGQLVYFDDAHTAGALGYHDLTHNGQPISKVFVKTTLHDGELVSVIACHEVLIRKKGEASKLFGSKTKEKRFAKERRVGRKPNGLRIKHRRAR